jgi:hypothetical protein
MFALLANVAFTVVSARDLVPKNTGHLFDKRLSSGCGLNWPVSCTANSIPSDLCCYESPGVRAIRYSKFPPTLKYVLLGAASPNTGLSTLMDCFDIRRELERR